MGGGWRDSPVILGGGEVSGVVAISDIHFLSLFGKQETQSRRFLLRRR